jgi:hypothetical protein
VPLSRNKRDRKNWVQAVAMLRCRNLFLDPDTGFYQNHTGRSDKMILVEELKEILKRRKAVIVYRHRYRRKEYVQLGLEVLQKAGLKAFAYQSQSASIFFISASDDGIRPFEKGLQKALKDVRTSRLVK